MQERQGGKGDEYRMKEVAGESIGPGSSLLGHQESHEPKTVGLLSEKWCGGSWWLVGEMGFKGLSEMFISPGKAIRGKRQGRGRKKDIF